MNNWIVIVDDDKVTLKILTLLLSKLDKKVTTFSNGRDFLIFANNNFTSVFKPDVILLDVMMPGISGFDVIAGLKVMEEKRDIGDIPVVFLTAEDEEGMEIKCLNAGGSDFIKKPFDQKVLYKRIENVINNSRRLETSLRDANIDKMTGFLNKEVARANISAVCSQKHGCLMVLDLDSFKSVNDIYGHDMGDKVLQLFSDIIKQYTTNDCIIGRMGGDEFIIFSEDMETEHELKQFTKRLNVKLVENTKELLGDDIRIPLGVSIGAVFVPQQGTDFSELFTLADQALYMVKHGGKHGYSLYNQINNKFSKNLDIDSISNILEERNASANAVWVGEDAFIGIYRYMSRYIKRYDLCAYKVLLTLHFTDSEISYKKKIKLIESMKKCFQHSLRNSDIMMQTGGSQFFFLLPEVKEDDIDNLISRIIDVWKMNKLSDQVSVTYESRKIGTN